MARKGLADPATSERRSSILILESDDIALANRHVVSQTVNASISARADVPDLILLVETDRGLAWQLWVVKDGNAMYPAVDEPGPFEVAIPDDDPRERN